MAEYGDAYGNGNNEAEVSFSFNKYKKPELLNLRQSVANIICNALFMVPGNIPSMPTAGVDIRQYFYKEESSISSEKIKYDLMNTCGYLPGGATIVNVDYSTQTTTDGVTVFLLIIRISFPGEEGDTALGVALKQNSNKNDYINFNFEYVDI